MKYGWYRMDDSAIVYQMVLTPRAQSLFRLGVCLTENVVPSVLNKAVEKSFKRYPFFKCELKRGFFRPYLDENKLPFFVEEDDGVLLKILDFSHNNRYLLRVTYFNRRIFADFFHGLCDGSGALEFFKTLIYYYFESLGKDFPDDNILTLSKPKDIEETEDAFSRYYKKPELGKGINSMAGGKAFRMGGKLFSSTGYGLIQATVETEKLLSSARSFNCSITVLLTALMLVSVAETHIKGIPKDNLTAFIPINLRKRYPSKTLRNFTIFAKIIIPKEEEITMDNMIKIVKKKFAEQLSDDEIMLKLGFSSLMARMPLFKYMPLFLKGYISKISRNLSVPKQTFILSNLGNIELGENDLIDSFMFNLNCNRKTPNNIAIVSYNGKMNISFTRKFVSTELERVFCNKLASLCGNVKVISNFREECDAL